MSVFVADLVGSDSRVSAFEPKQLQALTGSVLEARTTGMNLVLVLIGVGGAIYCGLLFTSRLLPRWLAGWGVVTYLSMLVLGFLSLVWPDHPQMLEMVLYGPGALFELTIGVWLVVKGVDAEQWHVLAERPQTGNARQS